MVNQPQGTTNKEIIALLTGQVRLGGDYGDDHWKWLISGGPFSGANETREFIIGSLGATRKGGVETGTTQEWHLL